MIHTFIDKIGATKTLTVCIQLQCYGSRNSNKTIYRLQN